MFDICLVVTNGSNWEQQWSYLLSHFPPRRLYHIGELDRRVRPFQAAEQITSAAELPGHDLVLMTPENSRNYPGDIPLPHFIHPEDCTYMFGSDSSYLDEEHFGGRFPDHLVYIPTATKDTMYSFMAGAITLWDRIHG